MSFLKIKNLLSTRSVSNALISKFLIYFSHQVDVDVVFKKKIRKNKNYLNKKTKNTKKYNQNNFKLIRHQFYSITKQLRENKYFSIKKEPKPYPSTKVENKLKQISGDPFPFFFTVTTSH